MEIHLKCGYYQIKIKEEDIPKTTLNLALAIMSSSYGLWPLTNARATLNYLMFDIFKNNLVYDYVLFYLATSLCTLEMERNMRSISRMFYRLLESISCMVQRVSVYCSLTR